jgi:hypothetical protein
MAKRGLVAVNLPFCLDDITRCLGGGKTSITTSRVKCEKTLGFPWVEEEIKLLELLLIGL